MAGGDGGARMRGAKPNMKTALDGCVVAPKAPAWLPDHAKREWSRVAPILTERRVLTDADLGSLANYCLAIGQVQECQDALKSAGMFFTAENGAIRPHPAIRVQHSAFTNARQLAAEMGLTPVSRSRPALNDDADEKGGFGDLVD